MEDICPQTYRIHRRALKYKDMNRLAAYIGKIVVCCHVFVLMAGSAYAQEYESTPVEISEQKVKIDGKVYYSHIVLEKQTLYSISKAYNVSVDEIYEANPGLKDSGLKKNAIINIPVLAAPAAENEFATPSVQKIHTVKWYEDLQTISDRYGVPAEAIVAANSLRDRKLKSRQKLVIPAKDHEYVIAEEDKAEVQEEEDMNIETAFEDTSSDVEEEEQEIVLQDVLNNKVKALVLLPLKATGTASSKSNMDFYSGVLLAARELGENGAEIDLEVHDIANGSFGATRHALENSDIIIGPVSAGDITRLYSIAPGIKALVSPLDPRAESLVQAHPTMIHAPASRNIQYKDVAKWMAEDIQPGDTVLVISEKEARMGDEGKLMRAALDSAGIEYIPFSYSILEGRNIQEPLEAIMAKEHVNRVLVASESEAFVNDVIRNLNLTIHTKHPVVLYGPAKIRTFDTIEVENFHNTSLHASLTYHIDYETEDVRNFLMKYRALFHTEPTQFAFQGYDVAKYFLGMCAVYGEDWMQHMDDSDVNMLQNLFSIRKEGDGGYSNTGIRRIIYGKDYEVLPLR